MKGHGIPIVMLFAVLGASCVRDPVPLFDRDQDGVSALEDCDDTDATIGALYQDLDGDGHGGEAATIDCSGEGTTAPTADDCNDDDPAVYPGALEVCNGVDDDCDGDVDEDLSFDTVYEDADADGYGNPSSAASVCAPLPGYVANDADCDDNDPDVHPGADETCNLRDDDCDGRVDEDVGSNYYTDADGDGHGKEDARPVTACEVPEGFAATHDDCNDNNPAIYPGAEEVCNGFDDDCDGQIDEDGMTLYYADLDQDGYGDPHAGITACAPPAGYVSDASDCDDTRADANPGASETCNDADDDCDGLVDEDAGIVAVAGGIFHTLALCSDGTVWSWGANDMGQLGDGSTDTRTWPLQVRGLDHIVAISAGGYHSVALQRNEDGESYVWVWGNNEDGQLGDGTTVNQSKPERLETVDNVIAVSAGLDYTVVVRSTGSSSTGAVWAWGNNDQGQLGDGTTLGHVEPAVVPGLQGIMRISAGMHHVLALASAGGSSLGSIWSWGANDRGQVGDGSEENRLTPYLLPGLAKIGAIAAGGEYSLALEFDSDDTAGTLWSWGDNTYGQLGDGTTEYRVQPGRIDTAPSFAWIVAGYHHALAIHVDETDGEVWSWGSNSDGQLGTGGGETSNVPVNVSSLADVVALGAGAAHSLAITGSSAPADHAVWAWGSNDYGQVGDGTRDDRPEPVLVGGI